MNTFRQVATVAIIFAIVGFGLLIAAASLAIKTHAFIAASSKTSGRVVGLLPSTDIQGPTRYYTEFTFTDKTGRTYTNRTASAESPAPFAVDDKITVLFTPDDPEIARIGTFRSLWMIPTFLFALGAGFMGIGTLAFIAARKTYGKGSIENTV